jgi:hypothetical protein
MHGSIKRACLSLIIALAAFVLAATHGIAQQLDHCPVCGNLFTGAVYIYTDKVTGEKVHLCPACLRLPTVCFQCGLPVKTGFKEFPDGRILCARDLKNVVVDDDEARQMIVDVQNALDKRFSRFISFPSTNVETEVVDRVTLQALFATPGNDFECPNILGFTQSKTNLGQLTHKISVLSDLFTGELKAVCAHELTHTWIAENVSPTRKRTLSADAKEGFCELVAYLLMDSLGDETQKQAILQNRYTRGQIQLFVEAERTYGFNDVVDWMRFGGDRVLHGENLGRIHDLVPALKTRAPATLAAARSTGVYQVKPEATDLELKGITWSPARPMAVINGRSFEVNELGQVRVAGTNLAVQCLAIARDSVRVKLISSGQERQLRIAAH